MASSVSMSLPVTTAKLPTSDFTRPLPAMIVTRPAKGVVSRSSVRVQASLKEKAAAIVTAGVISATAIAPEMAQAASNDFTPSLKNFLLSIGAGGFVLVAILTAVIGVSNFDPVKRG